MVKRINSSLKNKLIKKIGGKKGLIQLIDGSVNKSCFCSALTHIFFQKGEVEAQLKHHSKYARIPGKAVDGQSDDWSSFPPKISEHILVFVLFYVCVC